MLFSATVFLVLIQAAPAASPAQVECLVSPSGIASDCRYVLQEADPNPAFTAEGIEAIKARRWPVSIVGDRDSNFVKMASPAGPRRFHIEPDGGVYAMRSLITLNGRRLADEPK